MNINIEQKRAFRHWPADSKLTMPSADATSPQSQETTHEQKWISEQRTIDLALANSKKVMHRIATCSEDLGWANELLKRKFVNMNYPLSTDKLMSDSDAVKARLKACSDDLITVNEALSQALENQRRCEVSLSDALLTLSRTEAALAVAEEARSVATKAVMHDLTTGLPNRRLFDNRLEQSISAAERHKWKLAVMFLDLDRFKGINDTLGHAAGDEVLKEVSRRLTLNTRDEDTACRNGGDEFLFLLMNPQGREKIVRVARLILKNTAAPFDTGGINIVIKASIGIAVYPDNGTTADELIRSADAAMYKAKELKCGYEFS